MKYLTIILLLIPITLQAQIGPPCTSEIQLFYDDAGNRIQRKEVCDPNGGGGGQWRIAAPQVKELAVFPNPSSGLFELKFPSELEEVLLWVYDAQGKVLIQRIMLEKISQIDLTSYPSGVYLLHVRSGEFESSKTLLKE